jgi:hypothetical protein
MSEEEKNGTISVRRHGQEGKEILALLLKTYGNGK